MKKNSLPVIFILFVILLSIPASAQIKIADSLFRSSPGLHPPPVKQCGTDMLLKKKRTDPQFAAQEKAINTAIRFALRNPSDTLIILPVVVHIINQNPFSITDQTVIDGIQDLNDAYSKSGPYAASLGADTRIQFCLAKVDPDGGNTTGITRTNSFWGDNLNMDTEDGDLKNVISWDISRYINIYFINEIHGEAYVDFRCGEWYRLDVGGYAAGDGVVVTSFGIVLAHEIGHYLSLAHTFQGGCINNDCTTDGDMVCDTPPDNSVRPSASCASPENSCSTDTLSAYSNGFFPVDVPDQIANFMDYNNMGCKNLFTQGQADRMRASASMRPGLLVNKCNAPCNENILASFTSSIAHPLTGDNVVFTNTSTGTTNNEWYVDGTLMATTTNFNYIIPGIGEYIVMLKSFNTPDCYATTSAKIIVTCGVVSRFWANKKTIASLLGVYEDSIVFTNNSQNGLTYEWLISNDQGMPQEVVSTATDLTYVFPAPANYYITLVATAGTCVDTSGTFEVPVDDPTADARPGGLSVRCFNQNQVKITFCIANTGYAPIPANTPVNFYDDNPLLPTANRLSPTLFLPFEALGGACNTCYTHILNTSYSSLTKIYLVVNDAGTAIPVVLPNTSFPEKVYTNNTSAWFAPHTNYIISVCNGSSYYGHSTSGIYTDTITSVRTGCDSIRTVNLTIRPPITKIVNATICQGQSFAGYNTSGTYIDVFTAADGCDSTRTLNLIVKQVSFSDITASICQGDNYAGHTTSGTYVDVYTNSVGCDSTRTLHLTVNPVSSHIVNATICSGDNYEGYTISGTYVDVFPNSFGCDSTRTLNLTVNPVSSSYIPVTICAGQNYAGYTATGIYVDVFPNSFGCDSTRTLDLTVNPISVSNISISICQGQSYAGYTTSGTYVDVFPNAYGCDSTRTLHLTVKPNSVSSYSATICQGENYAGHTSSGIYVDVYPSANGCDSTRTLTLIVNPTSQTNLQREICIGESYFAQGQWQTQTGIYYDTLNNVYGCDSVIITNLIVHSLPQPQLPNDQNLCAGESIILNAGTFVSYVWQDGSTQQTYTASSAGIYYVTVTDMHNCKQTDTMKVLRMLALPKNFLPEDSTICNGIPFKITVNGYDEYLWNTGEHSNSIVVSRPDRYSLKVKNAFGCYGYDSVKIDIENCIPIQVPSAFTPDGNGNNDVFKPLIPMPVTNYSMKIFNRPGQLLFETHDPQKGWDGLYNAAKQPAAAYVYLITFTDNLGAFVKKYGSFILIR